MKISYCKIKNAVVEYRPLRLRRNQFWDWISKRDFPSAALKIEQGIRSPAGTKMHYPVIVNRLKSRISQRMWTDWKKQKKVLEKLLTLKNVSDIIRKLSRKKRVSEKLERANAPWQLNSINHPWKFFNKWISEHCESSKF